MIENFNKGIVTIAFVAEYLCYHKIVVLILKKVAASSDTDDAWGLAPRVLIRPRAVSYLPCLACSHYEIYTCFKGSRALIMRRAEFYLATRLHAIVSASTASSATDSVGDRSHHFITFLFHCHTHKAPRLREK